MNTTYYLSDELTIIVEPILKRIIYLKHQLHTKPSRIEHTEVIDILRECLQNLKSSSIKQREQKRIHFLLCTALDEAYQKTLNSKVFIGQSGTSLFHQSIDGGERFFEYLEKELSSEKKSAAILGLGLVLLNIGFEGKYALLANGKESLQLIRKRIFDALPHINVETNNHELNDESEIKRLFNKPMVLILMLCILCVSFFMSETIFLDNDLLNFTDLLYTSTAGVIML